MAASPIYVAYKAYEADRNPDGSNSNIKCANHTTIAFHSGKGIDSGLSRQRQSARPPLNILEEYMDESYSEPNLCDDGLDVTTSIYPTTDLSELGSLYDPDQSSDVSFQDTVRGPPVVYRVRSDVDQDCGLYGHEPFTVAHSKQPPEYSLTDEAFQAISTLSPALVVTAKPVSDPHMGMSIYERITGPWRTWPTARESESDKLAIPQPSGVTWTHSYGPFTQHSSPCACAPPMQQGLDSLLTHASRLETADRISRIHLTVAARSSSPIASKVCTPSSENWFWVPVVPHSENRKRLTERKGDDWNFSEIMDNKIKYHTNLASNTRIQLDKPIEERGKRSPVIHIINESIAVTEHSYHIYNPAVPEELLNRFDGCLAYKSKIDPSSSESSSADGEGGSGDED
ncbi:MAG: hypothetical protein Q9171_005702 [Xanthocarpia ochracea]